MLKVNKTVGLIAGAALSVAAMSAQADIVDIDISGTPSLGAGFVDVVVDMNAALGTLPGGEVIVDGIGWDVEIEAFSPSWLTEAVIEFIDSSEGLSLTVGAGDQFSGTSAYSSGGIVDLSDNGFLDITLLDGILTMRFFDDFDDLSVEPDAIWNAGTISISATGTPIPTVPEPGTLALLAIAGLGLVAGARKKA